MGADRCTLCTQREGKHIFTHQNSSTGYIMCNRKCCCYAVFSIRPANSTDEIEQSIQLFSRTASNEREKVGEMSFQGKNLILTDLISKCNEFILSTVKEKYLFSKRCWLEGNEIRSHPFHHRRFPPSSL